jgi:hypothetical protein
VRKALQHAAPSRPQYLAQCVDLQAQNAFFAFYVTSKCWDFLKPYYHPADSPDHLTLAIEAVSLAFLWHQVYSNVALARARERYVSALRMTNKSLRSFDGPVKHTALLASLVLDLFEKITDSEPRSKAWTSHIDGALALIRLKGLDRFQDPSERHIMLRAISHYIVNCVANGSLVPAELIANRQYVRKHFCVESPTWRLSDYMIEYANIRSEIRKDVWSNDKSIDSIKELDTSLEAFDYPPSWQYSTIFLEHKSDRVFDCYLHAYPDRHVSQARNFLRVIRILLNESLIERHLASSTSDEFVKLIRVAQENIEKLAKELCAGVPQYVDCYEAAQERLSPTEKSKLYNKIHCGASGASHCHTPDHQMDCYTVLFPLYVAGRCKTLPDMRPWVIKELHYIGRHFCIRNAELLAQTLEQETVDEPWEVYAMLGGYAFL